jgi:hypothetical protein
MAGSGGIRTAWDSKKDFGGPVTNPLSPFQQYVQVLLISNEFIFVD